MGAPLCLPEIALLDNRTPFFVWSYLPESGTFPLASAPPNAAPALSALMSNGSQQVTARALRPGSFHLPHSALHRVASGSATT